VYFDRVDDKKVLMRTLAEIDLASFPGRAYHVEQSDTPGTLTFIQLK